ncbi:MAG: hypothetical protein V4463_16290, partial [Pseudomonadota bacterium]
MTTTNTVVINEIPVDIGDPTKAAWLPHPPLADQMFFAIVSGTGAGEVFDAADISATTKTRMDTYQRGVAVNMGGGGDSVIGSAYGDDITLGSGVGYADGGANTGTPPGGGKALDILEVYVSGQVQADAVTVTALDGSSSDATDIAAYNGGAGYLFKVVNGGGQTAYIKNIEQVNIRLASDSSFIKAIGLTVNVGEIQDTSTGNLNNSMHYAWANGTAFGDTFNADTDISSATRTLMTNNGRGVWVDLGAGNDTVTGSGFGDNIAVGSGTNHVDGGANAGSPPWGGKAEDVLQVTVASQAAADAVTVIALAGSVVQADIDAANAGYTHKVTAGSEIDYIKNIERVAVQISNGSGTTFGRDIPLTINVHEADLSDANIANFYHLAWVNGTGGADTIDLSGNTALLSGPLKTYMAAHSHGVWVDGGTGDDIITGTAFSDNFRNGAGNAKIDGGANGASVGQGQDVFEINVADQAGMDAITVAPSDLGGYTWMVTYGTGQKDYLTNIEAINVNINGGAGKWIPLAVNVGEIQDTSTASLNNSMHYAWANGTAFGDTFNADTDITSATRTLMTNHGRGVWVDLGAGDDTVTGSGFGDNIAVGSGTNRVDGGANAGSPPWGGKAEDVLQVTVASQAAADAVTVALLAGSVVQADIDAANAGYTHKVTAGSEIDYIKNIERVSVQIASGSGTTFGRDIPLTINVHEADLSDANIANFYHLAWVNGTGGADTIDLSGNTSLLSDPLKTYMAAHSHGLWVDGGTGDDIITGTAFSDNFRNGAGNAKIDGGANGASVGQGLDVFEITVANQAAMDAITVAPSDLGGYTWMVTYGTSQKDYLTNIEAINVNINGG